MVFFLFACFLKKILVELGEVGEVVEEVEEEEVGEVEGVEEVVEEAEEEEEGEEEEVLEEEEEGEEEGEEEEVLEEEGEEEGEEAVSGGEEGVEVEKRIFFNFYAILSLCEGIGGGGKMWNVKKGILPIISIESKKRTQPTKERFFHEHFFAISFSFFC